MWFAESIRRWASRRRTPAESPSRKHDADADEGAVYLRFVHVCDSAFGEGRRGVEDVRDAAVRHELFVHGHLAFCDVAVRSENLA